MYTRSGRYRLGSVGDVLGFGCTILVGFALVSGGPARAQTIPLPLPGRPLESLMDLPTVPIEQRADVIVVLRPHVDFPLHFATAAERIISGDIDRVEKGVVPQTIVHTARTIVAPLRAGVPVKLFLKAFPNRNAYYIIGVFPESYGGQP